jgi:vacuolar-type H+-ATPase subunit I/STV1
MQLSQTKNNDRFDILCDELLRERATVLSRAGFAVDDAIDQLRKMEQDIQEKIKHLQSSLQDKSDREQIRLQHLIAEEVNGVIDQFNSLREVAQLKFYYLIVTREALGLRRHEAVREIYQIPGKKKKMQGLNG